MGGLLGNYSIPQRTQLSSAREREVGDPSFREPHEVLDEPGSEHRPSMLPRLGWVWNRPPGHPLPATNRRLIDTPIRTGCR